MFHIEGHIINFSMITSWPHIQFITCAKDTKAISRFNSSTSPGNDKYKRFKTQLITTKAARPKLSNKKISKGKKISDLGKCLKRVGIQQNS